MCCEPPVFLRSPGCPVLCWTEVGPAVVYAASHCGLALRNARLETRHVRYFGGCRCHSFAFCAVYMLVLWWLYATAGRQLCKPLGLAGVQVACIIASAAYITCSRGRTGHLGHPMVGCAHCGCPVGAPCGGELHTGLAQPPARSLAAALCCCECQHTNQRMRSVSCIQSCSCARCSLYSFANSLEPFGQRYCR